jgi:phosphatidylethanolamine/phosphatidyl-N-methylethanolamine N-methyltransferase
MTPPDPAPQETSGQSSMDPSAGQGRWLMFTKFLQRGKAIASFAPSSRFMVRSILRGIDFSKCRCIIELGAGTGPVTAELLKRVSPDCRLIIVELDPDLCRHLRKRFPTADIVQGDAADMDRLLDERGISQVDHILSGLPLPSFPEPVRDRILDISARRLHGEGSFRQLTVMPWVYYRLYRRYFTDVRFRFVPCNLPPGGVYLCRGWTVPQD